MNMLAKIRDRLAGSAIGLVTGLAISAVVAQGVVLVVQPGAQLGPSITAFGDAVDGFYFGTNRVGVAGHFESGLKASLNTPVLSACGGAVAGDAGSTDTSGTVTQGGTVTTCTITFGTAFTAAPMCIVSDLTGTRASMASTTTASVLTVTGITASDKLAWFCVAKSGG